MRLIFLLGLLSCTLPVARSTDASGAIAESVSAATAAWADAFNRRDLEGVLSLYAEDAVLWGTTSATLRNTPALRREYFSTMPQRPHVRVTLGEQHVRVFGDVAVNSGTYSFRDGDQSATPARFSFTYRRVDGHWMIIDHHSSASPAPRP